MVNYLEMRSIGKLMVATLFIAHLFTMIPGSRAEEMVPVAEETIFELQKIGAPPVRPFRKCSTCKCCSRGNVCATMPCCYGIKCNLPGKPFGTCAFVPLTCNCADCESTSL